MALQLPNTLGPWQPKITRIEKMWMQPCNINPLVWFLGYFAASPVLLGSILAPDCLDATADRVRAGHRRRRRGSMNVADYATPIAAPKGGAGWAVFSLGQAAQRIGFYFMLADATLDFIIHGTSLAYQFSGCPDPNSGRASSEMKNTVMALGPAASGIIGHWQVQEAHIYGAGPVSIEVPKGHAAGVGFSISQMTGQFPPIPDASFQCQVFDFRTGKNLSGWLSPQDQGDGTRRVAWAAPTTNAADTGANFRVRYQKTAGVCYVNGTFTASGANLEGATGSACGHSIPGIK